jgi:hypothetical protein
MNAQTAFRALRRLPRNGIPLRRNLHASPYIRSPQEPLPTRRVRRDEPPPLPRWAVAGAVTCMIALFAVTQLVPVPVKNDAPTDPALEKLQTHVVITKLDNKEVEKVPTGTSTIPDFPKTIDLPDDGENESTTYQLVGLGVRTVSFLSIEVYVVGLYVALDDIHNLQSAMLSQIDPIATTATEPEREKLKAWLLSQDGERVWNNVLKSGHMRTMFRIVPTRNTDFGHMRDGFVRGIAAKQKARVFQHTADDAQPETFEDDAFAKGMDDFKGILGGKRSLKKGETMLLLRNAFGDFEVRTDKVLGIVKDERISRLLWLNYLGGKTVSSEKARKSVVDGVMSYVERPIGTVEVKVE